jgi:hypothetical protein
MVNIQETEKMLYNRVLDFFVSPFNLSGTENR